jgi:hypothetical protein
MKRGRVYRIPLSDKLQRALPVSLPFEPAVVPHATRYWLVDNCKARGELAVTFRSAHHILAPTLAWLQEAGHV